MQKLCILFMMVLLSPSQVFASEPPQKSTAELAQTRNVLIGKEQILLKAQETVQQRIERLSAALAQQEKRLDSISAHLATVRQDIVTNEQDLRQSTSASPPR